MKKFRLNWTVEWEAEVEAEDEAEAMEAWQYTNSDNSWILDEGKPKIVEVEG